MNKYLVIGVVVLLLVVGAGGAFAFINKDKIADVIPGIPGAEASCQAEYDSVIKKHGKNFDDCAVTVAKAGSCDKSEADTRKKNIVIVLDSSGSMNATIGGETKLALAKKAAIQFAQKIDPSVAVGIVVYGHKGSNAESDKPASCSGVEALAPVQTGNTSILTQAIQGLQAKGWTPIAGGLTKAQSLFSGKDAENNSNLVILVTDGEETCGGDPEAIAEDLYDSDEEIQTNVIAFDLGAAEEASLKEIATAGHGTFTSAKDGASLTAALQTNTNFQSGLNCFAAQQDVWVGNSIKISQQRSMCLNRLDPTESVAVKGAIESEEVSESCKVFAKSAYEERHAGIKAALDKAFSKAESDTSSESNALKQIQMQMDANEDVFNQ